MQKSKAYTEFLWIGHSNIFFILILKILVSFRHRDRSFHDNRATRYGRTELPLNVGRKATLLKMCNV